MHRLSTRMIGILLAAALAVALAFQVNLQLTFRQVRHPVALNTANLEPNPEVVRGWYRVLIEQDTYLQMIRTELVDIPWAVALAVTLVLVQSFAAVLLRHRAPRASAFLFRWTPLCALGPAFDVVENLFSLAMLTDPWAFPDVLAASHTVASYIKFSLIAITSVGGLTVTIVAAVRGPGASEAGATNEREALSPR